MAKNDFARRLKEIRQDCINEGIRHGQQYAIDIVMVYLHRQGWGYDRIRRMIDEITVLADEYAPSMHKCMMQDIQQERLDAEIKDIIKGKQEFIPFRDRYPLVQNAGYERMPTKDE